jgi:PAS domain S-box-containing protein
MHGRKFEITRIVFAIVSLCVASVSLAGWITGHLVLASYGPEWKAMAPVTAVSIILLSCAVLFINETNFGKTISMILVSLVCGFTVFAVFERSGLIQTGIELSLVPARMAESISAVNTGVMSPLTIAVLFILSVSLLVFSATNARRFHALIFITGILTVYTGLIDLSGYIIHNLLLSGIISCPTGIAFVMLGSSFAFLADDETFPARILFGSRTSAIILRRMIPLVVFIVITQGIILNLPRYLSFNPITMIGLGIVIFIGTTLFVSVSVSSSMGRVIERLIAEKEVTREKYLQSEKKYGILIESLQEGVVILTREGLVVYSNRRTAEILSFDGDEIVNRKLSDFVAPENEAESTDFDIVLANNNIRQGDYRIVSSGDVPQYVSITFVPISRGNAAGGDFIAGIVDVTEKKSIEKKLRESLRNREVLLRELYHRTRNNMQIICSFIRLSRHNLETGESFRAFVDLENRIIAMSLVHEKLCKSEDLSRVNIREYTSDLVGLILDGLASMNVKIGINIDIPDITLPIDIVMPYGLIMSELVTNSCKHAFEGCDTGTIRVSISNESDMTLRCVYEDDGCGFSDMDVKKLGKTLGMQLIDNIITKQLKGEMSITYDTGFRLEFMFRTDLYSDRL